MAYENALYDDVHRWTYVPSKKLRLYGLRPYRGMMPHAETYQRMVRAQLRQAERFVMTDDFLRMAYDVSCEIEKVPGWINLARLPYKSVWIEHDQWAKVEHAYNRGVMNSPLDKALTAQRGGWLMQELDEESGMWLCSRWEGTERSGGEAFISNQQWLVAPEGSAIARIQPPVGLKTPFQVWPEIAKHLTPSQVEHLSLGLVSPSGDYENTFFRDIENRIVSVVNPILSRAIAEIDSEAIREAGVESYMVCMSEDRGLLRLLIAVLALMNEAPNVKHYVKPQTGFRYMGMHKLPYLGHSTITLELPKSKPLVYLQRLLDKASADRRRNRAHMARGHWRCIEYGKTLPIKCDHNPTLVEKGVGICTKCERMIRWIPAHQRGDAALGWVTHDYVLDTK